MKKFFDANVLVYAYTDSEKKHEARALIEEGGVTDAFAIAEAFGAIRRITKNHLYAQISARTMMGQLTILDVTQAHIFAAIKNQDQHIIDAIHLVCSEGHDFISFDKDFEEFWKRSKVIR